MSEQDSHNATLESLAADIAMSPTLLVSRCLDLFAQIEPEVRSLRDMARAAQHNNKISKHYVRAVEKTGSEYTPQVFWLAEAIRIASFKLPDPQVARNLSDHLKTLQAQWDRMSDLEQFNSWGNPVLGWQLKALGYVTEIRRQIEIVQILESNLDSGEPKSGFDPKPLSGKPECETKPTWDSEPRELSFINRVVKFSSALGGNARTVLSAFQEDGWTPRIDNPLTEMSNTKDALRTINKQAKTVGLKFEKDEEQIVWTLAEVPPNSP